MNLSSVYHGFIAPNFLVMQFYSFISVNKNTYMLLSLLCLHFVLNISRKKLKIFSYYKCKHGSLYHYEGNNSPCKMKILKVDLTVYWIFLFSCLHPKCLKRNRRNVYYCSDYIKRKAKSGS